MQINYINIFIRILIKIIIKWYYFSTELIELYERVKRSDSIRRIKLFGLLVGLYPGEELDIKYSRFYIKCLHYLD